MSVETVNMKSLAGLPKVPLKKTVQGAVTKIPRVFPGMSSRSTSFSLNDTHTDHLVTRKKIIQVINTVTHTQLLLLLFRTCIG